MGPQFSATDAAQKTSIDMVGRALDHGLHLTHNDFRFSLFQVVSAYTNTGMSLVDQSMVIRMQNIPTTRSLQFRCHSSEPTP
jgi:hypothetical protein